MKIAILGAEGTGKTRLRMQLEMQLAQAPADSALLLSDTTPLMTAICSDVLLEDTSLYAQAVEQHRSFGLTLVTATDLPWVGHGVPHDAETLRAQVNQRLREVLVRHGIGFSMVYGTGEARTQSALQAIRYAMGAPRPSSARSGWTWPCEKCSDPACEHRLFSDLLSST